MPDVQTPAPVADAPKPSDEDIKTANAAQEAKWNGDFSEEDLKVPYKKEEEDEDKDKDNDKNLSSESEEPEEVNEPPVSVVTVQDPGEYKPADYSFEVTLKDGKTTKISTPEDAEKISEDPDNFETPKQLLDFIKKSTQMQNKLDKDQEKFNEQKATFEQQSQTEAQRQENVTNIVNEITYLVGKNKLPKVADKYQTMDWADPEVAKQPGVKEQNALLTYMVKENALRAKAGIKPFGPIDALTAMQNDEAEKAKVNTEKQAGEARKAAGAKVAGVSPTQTGAYVPKGIAVGNPNIFKRNQAVWDN